MINILSTKIRKLTYKESIKQLFSNFVCKTEIKAPITNHYYQMNLKLEVTGDGSHTLFVPNLEEHYHSTNGAIQEAKHVFIDTALSQCTKKDIKILEIGFGTGLNAFMTMLESDDKELSIEYTTLELYPVSLSNIHKLNFARLIDNSKKELFNKLHSTKWEEVNQITPNFSILKKLVDFSKSDNLIFNNKFDIVYFDAFGPDKQPEVWESEIFEKVYSTMNTGGILTTYSAKGVIRRMMQSIGFTVERLPGPPGKREMLRATK